MKKIYSATISRRTQSLGSGAPGSDAPRAQRPWSLGPQDLDALGLGPWGLGPGSRGSEVRGPRAPDPWRPKLRAPGPWGPRPWGPGSEAQRLWSPGPGAPGPGARSILLYLALQIASGSFQSLCQAFGLAGPPWTHIFFSFDIHWNPTSVPAVREKNCSAVMCAHLGRFYEV